MGRPVWCRFCGHPAQIVAGVWPTACEKCDGADHWATQPGSLLVRKHAKAPRVKFDLNAMDRKMLRAARIAAI